MAENVIDIGTELPSWLTTGGGDLETAVNIARQIVQEDSLVNAEPFWSESATLMLGTLVWLSLIHI